MTLEEPTPDYASVDGFVLAVLGVLAGCRALDGVVASADDDATAVALDDVLLDAALGLVTLGERMSALVDGWALADVADDAPSARMPVEDLLR